MGLEGSGPSHATLEDAKGKNSTADLHGEFFFSASIYELHDFCRGFHLRLSHLCPSPRVLFQHTTPLLLFKAHDYVSSCLLSFSELCMFYEAPVFLVSFILE